jgi:hypothetical protein
MIDTNDKQVLEIDSLKAQTLKLTIRNFFDFYGRVIVYDLKLFGKY